MRSRLELLKYISSEQRPPVNNGHYFWVPRLVIGLYYICRTNLGLKRSFWKKNYWLHVMWRPLPKILHLRNFLRKNNLTPTYSMILLFNFKDSTWGPWTRFTSCSVTCGEGVRSRSRVCNGPQGSCPGDAFETQPCLLDECAKTGSYSISKELLLNSSLILLAHNLII